MYLFVKNQNTTGATLSLYNYDGNAGPTSVNANQTVDWRDSSGGGASWSQSAWIWWYSQGFPWVNATNFGAHHIRIDNNYQTGQTLPANTTVKSLTYTANATTAHTLSGNTLTVQGGITNASSKAHTISSAVALGANTTVDLTGGLTISGVVSGSSTLTKKGSGTLTLGGANTYSGATTVSDGTLVFSSTTGLGTTAAGTTVASGKILQYSPSSTGTTVAEPLTLNGGTLYGYNSATWSGAVTLGANSTVQVLSGKTLTISGKITGSYGLTKSAAGTLVLSGANDYTKATTISAGTLSINADTRLGTAPSSATAGQITFSGSDACGLTASADFTLNANRGIALNSTAAMSLTVNNGKTMTYNGVMAGSGSGGLKKAGAGTLILGGASTYSGATTVSAGTLVLNGSLASSAVTLGAATLTAGSGAHAVKSLTMNNASSVLNVGAGNTFSGSGAGKLTAGTVNFDASGWTATGTTKTWTIFAGGAAATCSGVTFNVTPATDTTAGEYAIAASGNNIVVTWTSSIQPPTAGTPSSSGVTGGGATVTLGSINMNGGDSTAVTFEYGTTTSYGSSATPDPDSFASTVTAGSATVTLTGLLPATAYSYRWTVSNSKGSVQKTGTFTTATPGAGQLVDWLSTAASGAWVNATTFPWFYNTSQVNWKNVTDYGAQHVRVNNNNQTAQTLSANTTVASLTYGSSATTAHTLSGSYTLTVNGGLTNASTATHTISSAVTLGAATTADVTGGLTLSGVVGGSAALTKKGTGTLTLSGANTYTGATSIDEGTIEIKSANALGTTAGGTTVKSGGALKLNPSAAISVYEPLTLSGGTITNAAKNNKLYGPISVTAASSIGVNASTYLYAYDDMTGSGNLTLYGGSGSYFLVCGTNTCTGLTTVNNSYFCVENTGHITGNVSVASGKYFRINKNSGVSWTYDGVLSGAGNLWKQGAGEAVLTGANSFTGTVLLDAGTLVANNATALGASSATAAINFRTNNTTSAKTLRFAVDYTTSRTVTMNPSNCTATISVDSGKTATMNGVFSGTCTTGNKFAKAGAGTLVMSAANTYQAPTEVTAGTLKLTGTAANSAFTVAGGILEAGAANRTMAGLAMTSGGLKVSTANTFKSTTGAANLTGGTVYFDASGWTKTGTTQSWTIFTGGAAATCSGVTLDVTLATGTTAGEYSIAASGNNIVVTWQLTQSVPAVQNNTVTGIGTTSATLGATVTADGNSTITAYGVRCGTSASPTGGGYSNSGAPTIGTAYTKAVSGLTANTLYYMRGFATNGKGTGYVAADTTFRTTANAPGAPTGLTFTPSNNKMTISWTAGSSSAGTVVVIGTSDPATAPTARTSYSAASQVYASATAGLGGKIVYVGSGTSVEVTGLTAGTQYYVRAYAYAGTGDASSLLNSLAYSGAVTGNKYTFADAPTGKPTGLTVGATTRTDGSLSVSWTKGAGSTYTLVLAIAGGTASTGTPVNGNTYAGNAAWGSAPSLGNGKVVYAGNGTSTTVTGLAAGTQYTFVAYAYNLNGAGTAASANYFATKSDAASKYTLATAPATVATVAYNAHATDSLTFKYTRGSSDSAGVVIVMKQGGAPTWTPTPGAALPGANSAFGGSGAAGSAAAGYVVYAGTGGTASGGSSLTVTELAPGVQYYVKAYAYSGSATGTTFAYGTGSTAANGWTLATEPAAASDFTATRKASAPSSTIDLSWTASSGASGYVIYRDTSSFSSSSPSPTDGTSPTASGATAKRLATITSGSTTTYSDSTCSPATTYYYAIVPYAKGDNDATYNYSAYAHANAKTVAAAPGNATGVTGTVLGSGSIKVTWTAPSTAPAGYVVTMYTSGTSKPADGETYSGNAAWGSATALGNGKVVYSGTAREVTVTGLSANTTYTIAVYAYNGSGQTTGYASGATATAKTLTVAPSTLTVTPDSATFVRITASGKASGDSGYIIAYNAGSEPTALVQGTSYSAGTALTAGKVIYKKTTAPSGFEFVADSGTTGYYTVYGYNGTAYSDPRTVTAAMAAISGGQVETFSYTNGSAISSTHWAQPDNGWSSTGWAAWDSSSSYIKIAQPSIEGKGLVDEDHLNQAGGNAMWFNVSNDTRKVRAYRAFNTAYTSGKVWYMFTVRSEFSSAETAGAGDGANKIFGAQFMSTAGDSSTIFASVGAPKGYWSKYLGIDTSLDGDKFPAGSSVSSKETYELKDYGHSNSVAHTVYGYIDLTANKMYAAAAYSGTDFTASSWEREPSSWDVDGATISANSSVAGMTLYAMGYCGNVYFDEVRVASTWAELMGGAEPVPGDLAAWTAQSDGNEMVRLSFTAPANAQKVIILDKSTSANLTAAEKALKSGDVGDTAGYATVVWKGNVTAGSTYNVEFVVPAGSTHYFHACAQNVTQYSANYTRATATPNPLATGTYPANCTVAEAFAYTNGTHLTTTEGSQSWMNGGKGWAGAWNLTTVPGDWSPGKATANDSGVEGLLETSQLAGAGGNMFVLYPGKTVQGSNKAALLKRELTTALSSGSTWWGMFTMKITNSVAKSWAGIQLIDESGNVKASIGKLWDGSTAGIEGKNSGGTTVKGTSTYGVTADHTYVYIFKWDGSKMWLHVQHVESTSNPNFLSYSTPGFTDPDDTSVALSMADVKYVQLVAENGNSGDSGTCVGDTWFDEIRFADTFAKMVGRTSTTPDAPQSFSATVDGKEMVRLSWTKNAAGNNVIIVATSDGSTPAAPAANTGYSVGDTVGSGTSKVIYKGGATELDHVVAPGSTWKYKVYSDNGDNLYSSGLAAGPAATGTYDTGEYLDTMSYTNATSAGSTWVGGQGWGVNWWAAINGSWTAVNPAAISSTVNIAGSIANSTAVGNALKLSNPGEGGAGTLERTTGGDAWGGQYNNTFYVAFRMAYSNQGNNRWAGLKLIDTTSGSKGVFIGRTTADTDGNHNHTRLGIQAANSSGGTEYVASGASGTMKALADTGGANNVYLVVAKVKWTAAGYATIYAKSYAVGGTLDAEEPTSWDASWSGAYLANVRKIQLQAGTLSTSSDYIGDVYFDEVRYGDSWDDLLGGVPPTQVWMDGLATTAYLGDWVTNAIRSRPVGERQGAKSLLTSSASPASSAFEGAGVVEAGFFGKEESDTVSVWHGTHQITSVATTPLYGFGSVSGGGTTLYTMDHLDNGEPAYQYHRYNLSALPKPAAFSAASGGPTKINLTWTPATVGGRTFSEVMVVRFSSLAAQNLQESNLHPEQGTTYMVGDSFTYNAHSATVIYRGTGTSFADTRRSASTDYYYGIYTVNNGYYSYNPGRLNATATTDAGGSGGMPTIDGDGSDWTGATAAAWNSADASDGEFVWNDKKGDLRKDTDGCYSADIDEFRVKADDEWVYFLLRLSRTAAVANSKTIDLQNTYVSVGLDTRLSTDSTKMTWLGDESATDFGGAYWGTAPERYASRQMAVHYVAGDENTWQVEMYAEDGATWYAPPTEGWQVAAAGASTDPCVEWKVARKDLGLKAESGTVTTGRFTVATFVNTKGWNENTKATANIGDGTSAAVDAMEIVPYGESYNDKDADLNAWKEGLVDKKVNFWADVAFDASGVVANSLPGEPVFSGTLVGHGSPTLTWSQSSDTDGFVTGYLFELAEDSATLNGRDGGTENGSVLYRINLKGADTTSFRPQTTGAQFWWRVRARDNGGQLSAGTIRRYSVEGQKDTDGPRPDLLYVGTSVSRFLDPTDDYREEVEASGDALAVVDDVYSEGTPPTFGFVLQWTDPSGVYATNRSCQSDYAGTTRYKSRSDAGYGLDGHTLDGSGHLSGGEGAFAWNILAQTGDTPPLPFGRVSPNWDLMLVDTEHTATFTASSFSTASPRYTRSSEDGHYVYTTTGDTSAQSGVTYYKLASGARPDLEASDIKWAYKTHLVLPTEDGGEIVTEGWTHVYDKDLPFLPNQTLWDRGTYGNNANVDVPCITNFVSQAFKLPAYDPHVSLYLTVSAEDDNAYGDGDRIADGYIIPFPTTDNGVSRAYYPGGDTSESSGSCADGPSYARNVTTNKLIHIDVRDDDSDGPTASTVVWAAANDGTEFTPSMLIATQTLTLAQTTNWAALNSSGKLLRRLEGTGQGVTYQLTDAMIGVPLTFLFNVYDKHTTSGLKYGIAERDAKKADGTATLGSRELTNTAFRTRSWNATGYAFEAVASPSGRPVDQGWFEKDSNGKYVPTADTSVSGSKTYYARSAAEEGWATSAENTAGFAIGRSTIKYYGNNSTLHGAGTGDGTVLAWEFDTTGENAEAKLSELFGVANIFDYIGHHSDGATNLVQLHAWDCDNDRTGDQADAEITFGTLLLTDDDATPPEIPSFTLHGTGTNLVDFGALESWVWTSATAPTPAQMSGIGGGAVSLHSKDGSTDATISPSWNSGEKVAYSSGGMKGATRNGPSKYFAFTISGNTSAAGNTRWTVENLTFTSFVTKQGPTRYTLTVENANGRVVPEAEAAPDLQNGHYPLTPNAGTEYRTAAFAGAGLTSMTASFEMAGFNSLSEVQGRTLSVEYSTDGGTSWNTLQTWGVGDMAGLASEHAFIPVSVAIPVGSLNSAANNKVRLVVKNGSTTFGFAVKNVSIAGVTSDVGERELCTMTVDKEVADDGNTFKDSKSEVGMTFPAVTGEGTTTVTFRLYGYRATKDYAEEQAAAAAEAAGNTPTLNGGGNWGINNLKLHGIVSAPKKDEVTDQDMRLGAWTNRIEAIDGVPRGYDTAQSGLWVTGSGTDPVPRYTLNYPAGKATGGGQAFAENTYDIANSRAAAARFYDVPNGKFDAATLAWILSGGAAVEAGTTLSGKWLLLPGNGSKSKATQTYTLSSRPAGMTGVTVQSLLRIRATETDGENGFTATVELLNSANGVEGSKTITETANRAWHTFTINPNPWSLADANVAKVRVTVEQATASGSGLEVDSFETSVAAWGTEGAASDIANGTEGLKLLLKTRTVDNATEIPLSTEIGSSETADADKLYTIRSTISDWDRDRTDDALPETAMATFSLYDDDDVAPQWGSMFGGPMGVMLGGALLGSDSRTDSGLAQTWALSDHALAEADVDSLSLLLNVYDFSGWKAKLVKFAAHTAGGSSVADRVLQSTAGDGTTSIVDSGWTRTESATLENSPSATNAWTISLSDFYSKFGAELRGQTRVDVPVKAVIQDLDADRASDTMETVLAEGEDSVQVGILRMSDQDRHPPKFSTLSHTASGYLFSGILLATNIPENDATAKALLLSPDNAHVVGGDISAYRASASSENPVAGRTHVLWDGELAKVSSANRFVVVADLVDPMEQGRGVGNTGVQRGDTLRASDKTTRLGTGFAVSNTYITLEVPASSGGTPTHSSAEGAVKWTGASTAPKYADGLSSSVGETKMITATRLTSWAWTRFSPADIEALLPSDNTTGYEDYRLWVKAFDADTDRPEDQLSADLPGPIVRVRDDDNTPPGQPGEVALTGLVIPESLESDGSNWPWTNNFTGVQMTFDPAEDVDGTSRGDLLVSGIAQVGGYRIASPNANDNDLTPTSGSVVATNNGTGGKLVANVQAFNPEDQGYGQYRLFAVDADNDRSGDALAGPSRWVPLAYDITPPAAIKFAGADGNAHSQGASDSVDDPTSQFLLTWRTADLGSDDMLHANYTAMPTAKKKGVNSLSPWATYEIWYRVLSDTELAAIGSQQPQNRDAYVTANYASAAANAALPAGANPWTCVTTNTAIQDTTSPLRKYSTLVDVSNTTQTVTLYDLDYDQEYLVVIRGRDKAGNVGPAGSYSWATNNTIKFALTQGVVRAASSINAMIGTVGESQMTLIDSPSAGQLGATLAWYAAGQQPDEHGVRTGRVSRVYELISRDASSFTENGTEDDWARVGGEVKTNWNYQIDSGDANSITNLSREKLRFYRASYGGRWRPENIRPLASEEVYAMNRIPLVEGINYVALHGTPWTNTLAGVFGTDLSVLPAGTVAGVNCTRVEFLDPASGTLSSKTDETFYFVKNGSVGKWVAASATGVDVGNVERDPGFFSRGFQMVIPPLAGSDFAIFRQFTNDNYIASTNLPVDENGVPRPGNWQNGFWWYPILQVPTTNATYNTTNESQVVVSHPGFSAKVKGCSTIGDGRKPVPAYTIVSMNLPVAVPFAVNAADPFLKSLVDCGFHAGNGGTTGDLIYTYDNEKGGVRDTVVIFLDSGDGTWKMWPAGGVPRALESEYFKPGDAIVIVALGDSSGNVSSDWEWTFTPAQFYDLPTRHMGHE